MASRTGDRPLGTDGTDFRHRERVCSQYNRSPLLKRRIKFAYVMHFMLWILMFIRLLPELCLSFGFRARHIVEKWPFPQADLWEYVWCFGSVFPSIFGYASLSKNRGALMRISLIGTLVFGLGCITIGCFQHALELMDYYYSRSAKYYFYDFPVIVLFYIFFSLCFQVHGFCVYFGYKLYSLWSLNSRKSK